WGTESEFAFAAKSWFDSKAACLGFGLKHGPSLCAQKSDWQSAKSIYEFHALDINGQDVSLEIYRGLVCIITNVATQ
uniref:Glutathione peroxidase 4 n=1 Tax=Pseudonaja textilis TaxID=8673 RepID=A0A670ZTJ6_PSETE